MPSREEIRDKNAEAMELILESNFLSRMGRIMGTWPAESVAIGITIWGMIEGLVLLIGWLV